MISKEEKKKKKKEMRKRIQIKKKYLGRSFDLIFLGQTDARNCVETKIVTLNFRWLGSFSQHKASVVDN